MLGAPSGALLSLMVPGFESLYVVPIFASLNPYSGLGNTSWAPAEETARNAVATVMQSFFAFIVCSPSLMS